MNPLLAILAAVVGYLLGSISFSRVIAKVFAPDEDIAAKTEIDIPGSEDKYEISYVSPTAVSMKMGPRFGFLTMVMDMLKVVIPTLVFKLLYPETPYHLIAAVTGLIGNDWPLYHGFKGGRGMSVIYAQMFVIDWLAVPVTALAGLLLSMFVIRHVLVTYTAGLLLIIPWLWFRTRDPAHLAYAIAVNAIFFVASIPDARQYLKFKREGRLSDMTAVFERHTGMWRAMVKMANRLGLGQDKTQNAPAEDESGEADPAPTT